MLNFLNTSNYAIETDFLFQNSIINTALISWFLAQLIKVILSLFKGKFDLYRFVGSGGMPSSHSSTVLGLATSILLIKGYHSAEFAIALIFCCVVMYDASGVRRAAGEQAKILNYMMSHWNETTPEKFQSELKELLGHTPTEVIAGAFLGIVVAFFVTGI